MLNLEHERRCRSGNHCINDWSFTLALWMRHYHALGIGEAKNCLNGVAIEVSEAEPQLRE